MNESLRARWIPWLLAAAALPLAAWVLWEGQRMFRADWASAAARQQVVQWVSGEGRPPEAAEWELARSALAASLSITPDSPELQERMGDLYSIAGQRDWGRQDLPVQQFQRAAAFYERALALRPSEPGTWAMLAAARQASAAPGATVQAAWLQAQRLGPFEGHVQPMLMQVLLADWDGATPEMQDWAKRLFDRSPATTQAEINALARRYGLEFKPEVAVPPT